MRITQPKLVKNLNERTPTKVIIMKINNSLLILIYHHVFCVNYLIMVKEKLHESMV